jgi:hypothetical protein
VCNGWLWRVVFFSTTAAPCTMRGIRVCRGRFLFLFFLSEGAAIRSGGPQRNKSVLPFFFFVAPTFRSYRNSLATFFVCFLCH